MLREESEKLFTSLEKMLLDEVIDQYASKRTVLPSYYLTQNPPLV
jgi:hypothetical protein